MEQYEKAARAFRCCLGSFLVAVIGPFEAYVSGMAPKVGGTVTSKNIYINVALWAIWILSLLILALSEWLFDWMIEHWAWLRRKLAGKDYIEGQWIDCAKDSHTDKILNIGWTSIEYQGGEITVHSEIFKTDGTEGGSYYSTFSKYERRELRFGYLERGTFEAIRKKRSVEGMGFYSFRGDRREVTTFQGVFHNTYSDRTFSVHGEKVLGNRAETNPATRGQMVICCAKKKGLLG